jgi:hypothetical protein
MSRDRYEEPDPTWLSQSIDHLVFPHQSFFIISTEWNSAYLGEKCNVIDMPDS